MHTHLAYGGVRGVDSDFGALRAEGGLPETQMTNGRQRETHN